MGAAEEDHHLRVVTLSVPETWHELDRTLRGSLPVYRAQGGNVQTWLGRRGPAPADERVIASVWSSRQAHDEATDILDLVTAHGGQATTVHASRIDVLPVRLFEVFERDSPMTILRVFRGRTHAGQLEQYIEEARAGTRLDGARPDGPGMVVCGTDADATFLTVSLWPDWAAIEACTGGNIQQPLTTRNAARIAQGSPTHYELVELAEVQPTSF